MSNSLTVTPRAAATVLAKLALLLVAASVAGQLAIVVSGHDVLLGIPAFFDVDAERNLPTLFAAADLLFAALLLALVAVLETRRNGAYILQWWLLACGFIYLAVDESTSLHERIGRAVAHQVGFDDFAGWIAPFVPILLVVGVIFFRFLLFLPTVTRIRFMVAGAIYLGGAIGMEVVAGRFSPVHKESLVYSMFATIEESAEMGGVIIFIWALLDYLGENFREVSFRLGRPPQP